MNADMDITFPAGTPADVMRFVLSLPAYTQEPINPFRVEAFQLKQMSMQEITLFLQDLIEQGLLASYGPDIYRAGVHMIHRGLCGTNQGYIH